MKRIILSQSLKSIINLGEKKINFLPKYLDDISYPGHYSIGIIDYTKSHGSYLLTNKGKTYIDLTAHWNTNLIDTGKYKELLNKNLLLHLGRLALEAPTASEMVTAEQAAFISMMQSFWPDAVRIFTHSTGALAVNDACWTASIIVAEKNNLLSRQMKGIVFEGAFHGRHDRSADATASSPKVKFRQNPSRFIRCTAPNLIFSPYGKLLIKETNEQIKQSLKEVEKACKNKNVAYIIIEYPFQAEGGAKLVSQDILKKLYLLCKKYSKLLIVDCVQMGGRVWSRNKKGIMTPFSSEILKYADFITYGKIFRVSGFMARNPLKLKRGFKLDPMKVYPERYGSTWVGGLVQMLSGVAIMEIVMRKKLWKNGLKQTKYAYNQLVRMAKLYSGTILNPRGRLSDTTYLGWDFINQEVRDAFTTYLREQFNILVLASGKNSIRWAPFLDITDKEIKSILNSFELTLKKISADKKKLH